MIQRLLSLAKKAGPLVIAVMLTNVLNFVFNAYLARALSPADYGFIALINTFWTILLVGTGAVMQITSLEVARARGTEHRAAAYGSIRRVVLWGAGVAAVIWLVLTPWLAGFFRAPHLVGMALVAPMIFFSLITGANRGLIQGEQRFQRVAVLLVGEAGAKLALAAAFVAAGLHGYAYLAMPLSVALAWLTSEFLAGRPRSTAAKPPASKFPWRLLGGNVLAGLGVMAFLSVDLLLAKHYLSATDAGHYAILSLSGKMVYFAGALLVSFMPGVIGKAEADGGNARATYWLFYGASAALTLSAYLVLGAFGNVTLPLLLGEGARPLAGLAWLYGAGIALFTLASVTVTYQITQKRNVFPVLLASSAIIMAVLVMIGHTTASQIAHIVTYVAAGCFVAVTVLDIILRRPRARNASTAPDAPKRILIFNWRDMRHEQAGGAEVYLHELGRRWSQQGHTVWQICGNDGHSPRFDASDGVNLIRRGNFYTVYLWAAYYYFARFYRRVDVIIDGHNGIPFFTAFYAREKVVCVVHHVHQDVFTRYLGRSSAKLARFMEGTLMPWAYRDRTFLTVSDSSKMDMIDRLGIDGDNIEIVHNGVDLRRLKPGPKAVRPTVVFVGRLKAYKSVDVLVRAFALVQARMPEARLIIAGTGEERESLEQLAASLGLTASVEFVGFITEAQKVRLLQQAWVFANPSYMEGWGITSIEANACGTPVIASDVPGLRDSVSQAVSGYLVPYGDPQAFASRIEYVLADEQHRLDLSLAAKHWANNFDWQHSAAAFMEKIS